MAHSLERYTRPPQDSDTDVHLYLKERSRKERERSRLICTTTKNNKDVYLPESLIIEILSRLRVKELLQYKSVCKSWYALISSPQFISKHICNYYSNNDDWHGCLLAHCWVGYGEVVLRELLLDETLRVLAHETLRDIPLYNSYVYGPCDGLYYLTNYGNRKILWNPAINQVRTLPPIVTDECNSPLNHTYAERDEACGFGFDPVSFDYKVVVINGYSFTIEPLSVIVYSLRTDSWKYCGDLAQKYELKENSCYVFVNGSCYWLGCISHEDEISGELIISGEVIISFSMAVDAFHEIQVPSYDQPAEKCLGVYDNSLAFFSVHENEKNFDIWTLNEGKWSKKISLGPFPDVRKPLGHWKDNKLILLSGNNRLLLCLPQSREIKDLGYRCNQSYDRISAVFAYMESLVPIKLKAKPDESKFDDVVECPFFFLDT